MVGKVSVRLQVKAGGDIRPQGLQHLPGKKAPGPVAGVHSDFKALQRTLPGIYSPDDDLPQVGGIGAHQIRLFRGAFRLSPGEGLPGQSQHLPNIPGFQPPLGGEKFEAVAVPGKVAGGDHHCAVPPEARENGGHKHGGGACHGAVPAGGPFQGDALHCGGGQLRTGKAGIPPHPDGQLPGGLPFLFCQPPDKGPQDCSGGLRGEVHRFPLHTGEGYPPNIAAVLQSGVICHAVRLPPFVFYNYTLSRWKRKGSITILHIRICRFF